MGSDTERWLQQELNIVGDYMYPALVSALTRLSLTARWSSFTAALSRIAGVPFSSLKSVLEWAKNNKGAFALIASAVVEAGMSIAEFFRGDDGKPDAGSAAAAREMSKYAKVSPDVMKMLNDVLGADGDKLALDLKSKNESNEQLARCAVAYVRDNLVMASSNAPDAIARVLELHAALQLFSNLSRQDVADLMANRISPIPPYSAVDMRPYLLAGI